MHGQSRSTDPGAGGSFSASRPYHGHSESYPHTARSANVIFDGPLTAPHGSGPYTERLSRDSIRPLAFEMRDVSSRQSSLVFNVPKMDRIRTAPVLSDFKMSDFRQVSSTAMQNTTELDNWPSTNSAGSNSWLRRLEHFLDVRLSMAESSEAKLLAYHECFAQFTELFKGYRPLLSRIHNAYDEHIKKEKSASLDLVKVEAEMFALQAKAQEEVRKSVLRVTEQLDGMKEATEQAQTEKALAQKQLADTEKLLEEAHKDVEHHKTLKDEIQEQARSFCSGYRWILKNVVKTEEPNDMDALENVTLINQLMKAQAENHSQQQQLAFYTRSSEIVYVQGQLEEERKAFSLEVERMTIELDTLRSLESDCRKSLEIEEEKCKQLDAALKTKSKLLENTLLPHLGNPELIDEGSPDIPELLRTTFPIVNRCLEREDLLDVARMCIKNSVQEFDEGKYPNLPNIFVEVMKTKYEQHTVAEWGRNFFEALESHRNEYDIQLIGSLFATTASSHLLLHRANTVAEFVVALREVAKEGVSCSDLIKKLPIVFPYKSDVNLQEITKLLQSAPFLMHKIRLEDISNGVPDELDSQLLDLLNAQTVQEVQQYTEELREGLIDESRKRKSKRSDFIVSVVDFRNRLMMLEPLKSNQEVASMVHRAFSMASYDEAFQMLFPQQEEDMDTIGDKKDPIVTFAPVDQLLMRLDIAGLLRRTSPAVAPTPLVAPAESEDALDGLPPSTPKATASPTTPARNPDSSVGSTVEKQAARLELEAKHEAAIDSALASLESTCVPRWAKVGKKSTVSEADAETSTDEVPFINLMITQVCGFVA